MNPSSAPHRQKQYIALARARAWRGNFAIVKRYILEAASYAPISIIQWYNLGKQFGFSNIEKIRELAEKEKS